MRSKCDALSPSPVVGCAGYWASLLQRGQPIVNKESIFDDFDYFLKTIVDFPSEFPLIGLSAARALLGPPPPSPRRPLLRVLLLLVAQGASLLLFFLVLVLVLTLSFLFLYWDAISQRALKMHGFTCVRVGV